MEDAVSALEREFRRINIDLEYSSRRLESEFKAKGDDFSSVVSLVQRMHALRAQLSRVREKVGVCGDRAAKREAVSRVAQQQLGVYHMLAGLLKQMNPQTLADTGEDASTDRSADWQSAALALTSAASQYCPVPSAASSFMDNKNSPSVHHSRPPLPPQHPIESTRPPPSSILATLDRTDPSSPLLHISPEQFQQLPALTRGRSTLLDTNRLLVHMQEQHLQGKRSGNQHSRRGNGANSRRKNSPPPAPVTFTLQQLEASGHRASGQTGRCMLAVLLKVGALTRDRDREGVALSAELCRHLEKEA